MFFTKITQLPTITIFEIENQKNLVEIVIKAKKKFINMKN